MPCNYTIHYDNYVGPLQRSILIKLHQNRKIAVPLPHNSFANSTRDCRRVIKLSSNKLIQHPACKSSQQVLISRPAALESVGRLLGSFAQARLDCYFNNSPCAPCTCTSSSTTYLYTAETVGPHFASPRTDMATIRQTKSISSRTLVDDSKFLEMDACFTAFDKDG